MWVGFRLGGLGSGLRDDLGWEVRVGRRRVPGRVWLRLDLVGLGLPLDIGRTKCAKTGGMRRSVVALSISLALALSSCRGSSKRAEPEAPSVTTPTSIEPLGLAIAGGGPAPILAREPRVAVESTASPRVASPITAPSPTSAVPAFVTDSVPSTVVTAGSSAAPVVAPTVLTRPVGASSALLRPEVASTVLTRPAVAPSAVLRPVVHPSALARPARSETPATATVFSAPAVASTVAPAGPRQGDRCARVDLGSRVSSIDGRIVQCVTIGVAQRWALAVATPPTVLGQGTARETVPGNIPVPDVTASHLAVSGLNPTVVTTSVPATVPVSVPGPASVSVTVPGSGLNPPVVTTRRQIRPLNTKAAAGVRRKVTTSPRTIPAAAGARPPTSVDIVATATAASTPKPGSPVAVPGFDGRTITLGIVSTRTHPVWGPIGRVIDAAIESHVAAINRRGGIGGRFPVRLLEEDAEYDPALTLAKTQSLNDRVVGFASILGTGNVAAVLPFLDQNGTLASPASQDAEWALRPSLLPVFNSYQIQAINGISYYLSQPGNEGNVVCAVSVQTAFGDTGTEGFKFAAAKLAFRAGPVVTVSATDDAPAAAIGALRASGCQGVYLTAGPRQAGFLVVASARVGYSPRWMFMGASFSDRLITQATDPVFEQSVWVIGDGTIWGDPTAPGMARLTDELLANDYRVYVENPDVGLTFGYGQALVFEAVLERAVVLGDLSRVGLRRAVASVGSVDMAGLGAVTDYSQVQRLANARTSVFAVDGSYRLALRVLARDYGSPAAAEYRK